MIRFQTEVKKEDLEGGLSMSPKNRARMLAEKWNRNDFEQAFYSTFKRGYSEDLGLVVRQLWLGLVTGKRSAAKPSVPR